jgi:hypothetical protein
VTPGTTYAYGVTATYQNWSSTTPTVSVTTPKKC